MKPRSTVLLRLGLGLAWLLAGTGCAARARGPGWESVSVGDAHACAIREQKLYCWGESEVGALGLGAARGHRYTLIAYPPRRYPARVAGRGWSYVRAQEETTCGVRRGRLYCWGDGSLIETVLMDEREVFRHPVRVGDRSDWRMAYVSDEGSCALREDGALFCADTYALGTDSHTLTRVGLEKDWSVIVGGDWTAGGISQGRLWLWGDDLQASTSGDRLIEVPGQRPWQDLALGDRHACAIQAGALYCWGDNQHGQLGDGTLEPRRQPQRVGAGDGWTDVTAAEDITCGIQDGALYCWGVTAFRYSPQYKQVSPPLFTPTPRLADPQRDWIAIETSPMLICGLRSGGRLACREHAAFQVGADGEPMTPADREPLPFAPPGTRRRGF